MYIEVDGEIGNVCKILRDALLGTNNVNILITDSKIIYQNIYTDYVIILKV